MVKRHTALGSLALALVLVVASALADELAYPETPVVGVMGLRGDTAVGWIAVRVDFEPTHALAGAVWYNNDGEVSFPRVLVGTGFPDGPGNVEEGALVAEDVVGASSSWNQVMFSEPIAASLGGLYVMFEIPEGANYQNPGAGGGPAFGYFAEQTGSCGWISGDGENWASLDADYSIAVATVLVPYVPGMLVKSLTGDVEAMAAITAPYLLAGPNPFNPKTEIQFGLSQPGKARLDIFDLRGQRVVRLLDASLEAGAHSATWLGCDNRGRAVASGVYFVRLQSEGEKLTQKVMLVR